MKSAVVVCGPIASGKSTAISYLASEFDLKIVSFGAYVRSISERAGGPETREALQDLGNSLLTSWGASNLLQAALEHARIGRDDSVIFDGVRHPEILREIRYSYNATIAFYLHASQEERYFRYNTRQCSEISFDEFLGIENHPVEVGIAKLEGFCECVIDATRPLVEMKQILRTEVAFVVSTSDGT